MDSAFTIARLSPEDVALLQAMSAMFAEAFDDADAYAGAPPGEAWLRRLLAQPTFIAIAARDGEAVVGGLVAYVLEKFEQERSEIYIYDLAVAESRRRRGIATAMIAALKQAARARGAYVVHVQADLGDDAAIALYTKLGAREDVLHFDMAVD